MQLVTFRTKDIRSTGALVGGGLIDLGAAGFPKFMLQLITQWPDIAADVRRRVDQGRPDFKLDQVHLGAPVPNPKKILAIGLNYADHIAESGVPKPEEQVWFSKMPSAINGPHDPIDLPKASGQLDYEAELVVVIGKRCRHVAREDAAGAVFVYTCGNDVSVRDWQFKTTQWILGKSFDTHAPIGPSIVTSDEIGDPHELAIRCLVNGELRQNSNTKHLVFNVYDQIAYLSQVMTLEPGDLIFTGTPGGVGFAMKPPSFLKAGDTVRVEIDKIGALEAKIRPEK